MVILKNIFNIEFILFFIINFLFADIGLLILIALLFIGNYLVFRNSDFYILFLILLLIILLVILILKIFCMVLYYKTAYKRINNPFISSIFKNLQENKNFYRAKYLAVITIHYTLLTLLDSLFQYKWYELIVEDSFICLLFASSFTAYITLFLYWDYEKFSYNNTLGCAIFCTLKKNFKLLFYLFIYAILFLVFISNNQGC